MEHATSSTSAELSIVKLQHLHANFKIDSGWLVTKDDPHLNYHVYFDLLLSAAAVHHDQRNQLSVKQNYCLQHNINYLDMDYQDYEFLAATSLGEYAGSYLDDFEMHITFQKKPQHL